MMKGVKLISKTTKYVQDSDSCSPSGDDHQFLDVEVENAGGGNYLVIRTERWAIDVEDLPEFVKMLQSVLDGVEDIWNSESIIVKG